MAGWADAWQNPGSGAGPSMISGSPVSYVPPQTMPAASSETMRPRQNAGGDFWGPVVMRLIKKYRAQQMGGGGGFDALGMGSGGSSTVPLGSGLEER